MAVAVVDAFEVVDVEHQVSQMRAFRAATQNECVQPVFESAAVAQAGERVGVAEPLQLLVRLFELLRP